VVSGSVYLVGSVRGELVTSEDAGLGDREPRA